jgi:hypothetical protein
VAKYNDEQHVSAERVKYRDTVLKAIKEAEVGWERAMEKIAERARRESSRR